MKSPALLKKILNQYPLVGGLDEAGRGPLAGPVVASIVAIEIRDLPLIEKLPIKDSKKISAKKREQLFDAITRQFPVGVGLTSPQTIDRINILNATFLAMKRALADLKMKTRAVPDFLLLDGNHPIRNITCLQQAIPKADENFPPVAAASIIAKVTRDRLITENAAEYPLYGFEKHKGYGTQFHLAALEKYGPCPLHRQSFRPVKRLLKYQRPGDQV